MASPRITTATINRTGVNEKTILSRHLRDDEMNNGLKLDMRTETRTLMALAAARMDSMILGMDLLNHFA